MNFLSSFSKAEMVHPYGSLILLVSILPFDIIFDEETENLHCYSQAEGGG